MIQRFRKRNQEFFHSRFLKVLGVVFIFAVLSSVLFWTILKGYSVSWSGFGDYTTSNGDIVRGKTFWDWMELLVVPMALAGGAYYLNSSERESERQRAEDRSKLERGIAADRQNEATLQSYFDRMTDLLLKEKLRTTKNKEVRDIARIRTLSVLRELDGSRKGLLLLFLHQANLINKKSPVINLEGADLTDTYLARDSLLFTDLRNANLSEVDLSGADLSGADLSNADLSNAGLLSTNLSDACLVKTNLDGVITDGGTDLSNADLSGAAMSRFDLFEAILEGATMPDGTKHK